MFRVSCIKLQGVMDYKCENCSVNADVMAICNGGR